LRKIFGWKRVVGILIAFGLLFVSFYKIDLQELWQTLRRINFLYIIGAFVSAVGMNWAKGMRWREIMINVRPIAKTRIFALFHVSQMINLSLPALTGQAGRIVMLSKQEGLSKTFCFTTVVMEVLFDGISLIVLIYASSFIFAFPDWIRDVELYVTAVMAFLILILSIMIRKQRALVYFGKTKIRKRFPRLYVKLKIWAKSVSEGLNALTSATQILKISFYSILIWLFHICVAVLLIWAFKLDVPAWAGVVIIIVNSLLLLVPITPGNVGSFQLVVIAALAFFGVPRAEAAAFSVVMHFMDIVPVFAIGICFLFTSHLTFRKLRDETVQEAQKTEYVG